MRVHRYLGRLMSRTPRLAAALFTLIGALMLLFRRPVRGVEWFARASRRTGMFSSTHYFWARAAMAIGDRPMAWRQYVRWAQVTMRKRSYALAGRRWEAILGGLAAGDWQDYSHPSDYEMITRARQLAAIADMVPEYRQRERGRRRMITDLVSGGGAAPHRIRSRDVPSGLMVVFAEVHEGQRWLGQSGRQVFEKVYANRFDMPRLTRERLLFEHMDPASLMAPRLLGHYSTSEFTSHFYEFIPGMPADETTEYPWSVSSWQHLVNVVRLRQMLAPVPEALVAKDPLDRIRPLLPDPEALVTPNGRPPVPAALRNRYLELGPLLEHTLRTLPVGIMHGDLWAFNVLLAPGERV